ncbi:MAG TPA: hypothetical protein DCR04_05295 [Flavobacteriales bacterium]|nr:hypothetical protein [Flavobacteriales bacterium]
MIDFSVIPTSVAVWWGGMSAIAVFNLIMLFISRKMLLKKLPNMSQMVQHVRNYQFLLASIYTIGCGFRSILPRGDVRRIVLVDHWISAIAIGRSVATIAELAFVAQWAFLLHEIGKGTKDYGVLSISKIIVPMIFIAECFSWYACTTGNFFGTTIEESLWAAAAALTMLGFIRGRKHYQGTQKNFLTAGIVAAFGYVVYMVTVDVPAYVNHWIEDQANGKVYASLSEGFHQVATVWRQTYAVADWQYEFVWMSLYFSVAVWISIYIMNGPEMDKGLKND